MTFSGFRENTWQDMRFGDYLNKTWDAKEFCHLLALTARNKIWSEMAMASGEVSKMPILWDKDDWKFLYQFPPELWNAALKWRYNDGLRDIMRHQQHDEHIPDGMNYTDHIVFDKPGDPNIKMKFGKEGDEKKIYIGLTNLAHKLTDPHKGPKSMDPNQPYWAGEGPGLHEIDPNQKDPNHPKHPNKYKHGLYDFDLSNMAEVSPESIEDMPDWEIFEKLPEKYHNMDIDNPLVQKEIKKKRAAMLKVLKHTMAGYSVLQQDRASEHMANWIKANSLPEKLQGEAPSEIEDPHDITDQGAVKRPVSEMPISKFVDPKQLSGSATAGNTVPAVEKTMHWTEYNKKKGTEKPVTKTVALPVLNPAKTFPGVNLTDEERLKLAQKRGYDVKPGETWEELSARNNNSAFVTNTKLQGLQGLLDNWDIFSPERKAWMKAHVKDLMHVAQNYHAGEELDAEGKPIGDPHANPKNRNSFLAPGFYPNYGTPELPKFKFPESKLNDLVQKYKGRIYAELIGSEGKGKVGEDESSMLSRIFRSMKKSAKNPPQVIDALESSANSGDLTTFLTYMLLTYLNDPYVGIKDDQLGLLANVPEGQYDEKANKTRRQDKVFTFLSSIAQYGSADVLTRRQRERYGAATKSSLDKPVGDTGASGAGQVADAGKTKGDSKVDTSAKRAYLHSGTHTTVRASHKFNKSFSNAGELMSSKRNFILSKLGKVPGVAADLDHAEKMTTAAINASIDMFQSYQDQHPEASEEEILKYVHNNLQNTLKEKNPQLFGGANSKDWENILAKTKGLSKIGIGAAASAQMESKVESVYTNFLDTLMAKGEAEYPVYDVGTNEFKTGQPFSIKSFTPDDPSQVIQFISALIPEQFSGVKDKLVQAKGLPLWKDILVKHPDATIEDEEEIQKLWSQAYEKWKSGGGQKPQAAQQPQQAQPAAMPKPAVQPQAAQAAKPVGDLLNMGASANTPQELTQIGNELLGKKNELIAMPGSAAKLQQALAAMKKRRFAILSTPITQDEHLLFKKLGDLVGELHAAQG